MAAVPSAGAGNTLRRATPPTIHNKDRKAASPSRRRQAMRAGRDLARGGGEGVSLEQETHDDAGFEQRKVLAEAVARPVDKR